MVREYRWRLHESASLAGDHRFAMLVNQGSDPTLPYQALVIRESANLIRGFAPCDNKAFSAREPAAVEVYSPDSSDCNTPTSRSRSEVLCSVRGLVGEAWNDYFGPESAFLTPRTTGPAACRRARLCGGGGSRRGRPARSANPRRGGGRRCAACSCADRGD